LMNVKPDGIQDVS